MHPGVIGACKGYWLCLYLKQIFQFSWRTVLKYSDKFKSINVSSWVLACPLKFLNLWNMQLVVYASLRNISHRSYRMKNFFANITQFFQIPNSGAKWDKSKFARPNDIMKFYFMVFLIFFSFSYNSDLLENRLLRILKFYLFCLTSMQGRLKKKIA